MVCAKCGNENADKKCGKCYVTHYCSRECQQQHWKSHKKLCSKLAKEKDKDAEGAPNLVCGILCILLKCRLSMITWHSVLVLCSFHAPRSMLHAAMLSLQQPVML
jgi:hypothetical protein